MAFFFFTNGYVAKQVMNAVEGKSVSKHELKGNYEIGILLGGMIDIRSDTSHISFNENGDRLYQALDLYHSNRIDKILISSGSGMVQNQSFKESYLIKHYILNSGIPDEDIIIETISNNTYENAVETNKILESIYRGNLSKQTFPLITSASHTRRANACFKKQGLNVIPYSTNNKGSTNLKFNSSMVFPNPKAFHDWAIIMHEFIGYNIYRIKGYL